MSGFTHSIAGGSGNLNITTFQNPTYVPGSNGWQVTQAGAAEFNDVMVRGTVEAGFFIGWGPGGEILLYSGNPASGGTLLMSVSSSAGADPWGNAYGQGFYLYSTESGVIALAFDGDVPVLAMRPLGVTHMAEQPLIFSAAYNAGQTNEYQWLVLSSGKSGTGTGNDDGAIQLQGEAADGSVQAAAIVEFGGTVVLTVSKQGVNLAPVSSAPPAPTSGCTLYYSGGSLYALGPSGTPVMLATT